VNLDYLLIEFDKALRAVAAPASGVRPVPGAQIEEPRLRAADRRHAAALMRVNHVGEVCAQALYQGQSLTSRSPALRQELGQAAQEEVEHLAWTGQRIAALGGRRSALNPAWYAGALAIGMLAGACGDRWNLGFLAETERQVGAHLDDHLGRLPAEDLKSREVLKQMREDELSHAALAVRLGAAPLPLPVRILMRAASRVMTRVAYFI